MGIDSTRKQFEDIVFNAHFMSTIGKTGLGGCVSFMPDPSKTIYQDELCERDGENYKREDISAMWFGWQKAIEYTKAFTETDDDVDGGMFK